MTLPKAPVAVLLGALFGVNTCFCGVFASKLAAGLLSDADLVVVADVQDGVPAATVLSLHLTVHRTLKGAAAAGTTIPAAISSPNVISAPEPGVRTNGAITMSDLRGKTGIWFLQRANSGWAILPLAEGDISSPDLYLPVPPGGLPASFATRDDATPKEKLIEEIRAAAENKITSIAVFRLAASRTFVDLSPDLQIGQSMCDSRTTDPAGIEGLGALLKADPPENLKRCIVYALRETHTKETLPFLSNLLNDASERGRYDAVIGIAQFAMGFPVAGVGQKPAVMEGFRTGANVTEELRRHFPGQEMFARDEQTYILYWKDWLTAHPAK